MKNLIRLGFIAFICMTVSLLTINNTFAQGQGKGKGKGLLENRGIQNGEGFTTGQGHLNGNSAVDLVDCVEEGMAYFGSMGYLSVGQVDEDSFFVQSELAFPWGGYACWTTYYNAFKNDLGDCEYVYYNFVSTNGHCN